MNTPLFPAFRSRNYQFFSAGQGISLIGTSMTQLTTLWLVYYLTASPLMLGIVGFSSQIPSFFLAPFGGVFVDRFSPYRTLIGTQVLAMIQSLTLAALALTGVINIWHIIALSLFQGFINALSGPASQAFISELVERRDLGNAIATNSIIFNIARLIGPAIGGLLIVRVGTGYCFLIDGFSYIAVIAALLAMEVQPGRNSVIDGNPLQQVQEGFVYAFSFPPIRSILLLSTLVSLMGLQITILVPVMAKQVFKGDAGTLGFLIAASAIGALIGGIYLATHRQRILGIAKLIALAPAMLGIGLIAFSLSRFLPLSLFAMLFVGLSITLHVTTGVIFLQKVVQDNQRGRLISLYRMSSLGMVPVGNLLGGIFASNIGATNTLIIDGIICILGSIIFSRQLPNFRNTAILNE